MLQNVSPWIIFISISYHVPLSSTNVLISTFQWPFGQFTVPPSYWNTILYRVSYPDIDVLVSRDTVVLALIVSVLKYAILGCSVILAPLILLSGHMERGMISPTPSFSCTYLVFCVMIFEDIVKSPGLYPLSTKLPSLSREAMSPSFAPDTLSALLDTFESATPYTCTEHNPFWIRIS